MPTVLLVKRSMRMKPPSVAILVIGSEGDGRAKIEIADADLVERQGLGRDMLERVDVDLVFRALERAGTVRGADLDEIGPAGQHRLIAHPQDAGLELVGRRSTGSLAAQRTSPRLISTSSSRVTVTDWPATALVEIAVIGDDARRRGWCGPTA